MTATSFELFNSLTATEKKVLRLVAASEICINPPHPIAASRLVKKGYLQAYCPPDAEPRYSVAEKGKQALASVKGIEDTRKVFEACYLPYTFQKKAQVWYTEFEAIEWSIGQDWFREDRFGFLTITGQAVIGNSILAHALFLISTQDGGELAEVWIATKNGLVELPHLAATLGVSQESCELQKYRYADIGPDFIDVHQQADGWCH